MRNKIMEIMSDVRWISIVMELLEDVRVLENVEQMKR